MAALRAIAGFTGLLRARHYETIDADGRRCIDRVLAVRKVMSNWIDDLLELGRSRGWKSGAAGGPVGIRARPWRGATGGIRGTVAAIVIELQRNAQRHGGRLWADAAVDRGTTIYFSIAKGQQ